MFAAWLVRQSDFRGYDLMSVSVKSPEFNKKWGAFTRHPDFEDLKNKFMEDKRR